MNKEYGISIDEEFRKDVGDMCNLSQGIKEDGIAIGRAEGEAKISAIVANMHQKGFTLEQIAAITDKKVEEVRAIIEAKEPVMV